MELVVLVLACPTGDCPFSPLVEDGIVPYGGVGGWRSVVFSLRQEAGPTLPTTPHCKWVIRGKSCVEDSVPGSGDSGSGSVLLGPKGASSVIRYLLVPHGSEIHLKAKDGSLWSSET